MSRYGKEGYGPRSGAPLEQRLDRWVSAGRQFVDGVSGVRPGSRPGSREPGRRPAPPRFGRWVEERLDWLLDDGDDWREPWQQSEPAPATPSPAAEGAAARPRRSLDAISRRREQAAGSAESDWPDDASFSLPRWQRAAAAPRPMDDLTAVPPLPAAGGRPLPRSSRRRA